MIEVIWYMALILLPLEWVKVRVDKGNREAWEKVQVLPYYLGTAGVWRLFQKERVAQGVWESAAMIRNYLRGGRDVFQRIQDSEEFRNLITHIGTLPPGVCDPLSESCRQIMAAYKQKGQARQQTVQALLGDMAAGKEYAKRATQERLKPRLFVLAGILLSIPGYMLLVPETDPRVLFFMYTEVAVVFFGIYALTGFRKSLKTTYGWAESVFKQQGR